MDGILAVMKIVDAVPGKKVVGKAEEVHQKTCAESGKKGKKPFLLYMFF